MAGVRVKICGITNEADAQESVRAGADSLGFNFYSKSPRCIAENLAADILKNLPPSVEPVALFVEESFARMTATCQRLGPVHTIQYHGAGLEPPPSSAFRFIPAFGVADATNLSGILRFVERCRQAGHLPAAILLDASIPGMHGGTGQTAPWNLLADFQPGVPVILAGGLTPENVAEAIRIVQPYAVDVASGVESSPGRKDPDKVRRFIVQARAAAAQI